MDDVTTTKGVVPDLPAELVPFASAVNPGLCHIEHVARSTIKDMSLAEHRREYDEPLIMHRVDIVLPLQELPLAGRAAALAAGIRDQEMVVGRLLVNEFPRVFQQGGGRGTWFWTFDQCSCGPSEELGGMVDALVEQGLLEVLEEPTGTVLHLQNLEVMPSLRRRGFGRRLVRQALALLSRTWHDVVVADASSVHAAWPALNGRDDYAALPTPDPGVVRALLVNSGFTRWFGRRPKGEVSYENDVTAGSEGYYLVMDEDYWVDFWEEERAGFGVAQDHEESDEEDAER